MINSAALWPLLEPQWKDPKKWWKELSEREGQEGLRLVAPRDALLARRVSTRSAGRTRALGVAHGCFWRYHPARAWAWELRLQDEIGPDFRIEKPHTAPAAVT